MGDVLVWKISNHLSRLEISSLSSLLSLDSSLQSHSQLRQWPQLRPIQCSQNRGVVIGGSDYSLHSDREIHFWHAGQNVRQAFGALPDILSPRQTFFPALLANISGHSCFPCWIFYAYWTLLDKMSGKVWALCRTSEEVCRTCPACPAYFAITALLMAWQHWHRHTATQTDTDGSES